MIASLGSGWPFLAHLFDDRRHEVDMKYGRKLA
jgi:hypothetical protein